MENELELYKLQYALHLKQLEEKDRMIQELRKECKRLEELILSLKDHLQ